MKIFLDCGTHKGEGLTEFYNSGTIIDGFKVYCFEPIPNITNLEDLKNITAKNGNRLGDVLSIEFLPKAVWIKNDKITFNSRNDHAAHVDGIGYVHEGDHIQVLIDSVDFSKFVKELPLEANIICKMDIEGSEYKVLRHMLDENTIERIDELFVEFHPHLMPSLSNTEINDILNEVNKKTKLLLWH